MEVFILQSIAVRKVLETVASLFKFYATGFFLADFADFFCFLFFSIGVDGSIDYSVLPLPTRYPFFYAYLVILSICVTLALLPLFLRVIFTWGFNRRRIQIISVGRNANYF